jgi:RNA polymerase sigma factor (sigma-70 family)
MNQQCLRTEWDTVAGGGGGGAGAVRYHRGRHRHSPWWSQASRISSIILFVIVATATSIIITARNVQAFAPVWESNLRRYHLPEQYLSRHVVLQSDLSSASTASSSSSKSKRFPSDDLLENEEGKINPELAQRLWKWEQEQRLNLQILGDYSTRRGLRWVKDLVHSWDGTSTVGGGGMKKKNKSPPGDTADSTMNEHYNYEDLIQEGVVALMQSLKSFEHTARPDESFEQFAKTRISLALESYMLERDKGTGERLGRRDVHSHPLSMESTVAIMADPLEAHNYYFSQDEWEKREGLLLDDGKSLHRDELVDAFLDEDAKSEGDDQMWVHEQMVASPLRESIPADENESGGLDDYDNDEDCDDPLSFVSSPEALFLQNMLLHDVDSFLGRSSLDDIEIQLIQMQFGLDDGVPKPQKEIAYELDLTVNQVRRMRKVALAKLRKAFTKNHVDDETSPEDVLDDTP